MAFQVEPFRPKFAASDEFSSALSGVREQIADASAQLGGAALRGKYASDAALLNAQAQLATRPTTGTDWSGLVGGLMSGIGGTKWFKNLGSKS